MFTEAFHDPRYDQQRVVEQVVLTKLVDDPANGAVDARDLGTSGRGRVTSIGSVYECEAEEADPVKRLDFVLFHPPATRGNRFSARAANGS